MLKLNKYEQEQYSQLILKIRADLPFKKQQASVYIPLVRGRVCVALNQAIDRREISDIRVDRSEKKLTDISTYKQFINLGAPGHGLLLFHIFHPEPQGSFFIPIPRR